MGEPVKVDYLARQMIRLSGHIPGEEIEITYTGLRPGEKLTEELFHPGENLADTGYEKILLAENRPVDDERVTELMAGLDEACNVYNYQAIDAIVSELVPEYRLMDEQTETIADTG
jgi:FlaA1/EpsC-like NDP-sugar epimerase